MAFSFGFFNSKNLDRVYTAESFTEYLSSIICDGIQDNYGQCFKLSSNGLNLTVDSGKAWIKGHYFISDTAYTIDLSSYVNTSLPRYVTIGICCDTGENYRKIEFEVLAGAPATNPPAPNFQNTNTKTYLTLCTVLINAGAKQLSVTDCRADENICGYVRCILGKCKVTEMLSEISAIKQDIEKIKNSIKTESENIKELKNYLFNTADSIIFEKDSNGNLRYRLANGMYATGEQKINGIPYKFDSEGVLQTGWQTVFGKTYYYNPKTGNISLGWIEDNGNRYYVTLMEGKLVSQHKTINGIRYWFDESGITKNSQSVVFPDIDGDGAITSSDASTITDFYSKSSSGEYTNNEEGWKKYLTDNSLNADTAFPDVDEDGIITSSDASIVTDFYSKASSGKYTNDLNGWEEYIFTEKNI